jgi:hypothetical protein
VARASTIVACGLAALGLVGAGCGREAYRSDRATVAPDARSPIPTFHPPPVRHAHRRPKGSSERKRGPSPRAHERRIPLLRAGQRSELIRSLQLALARLGYWVGAPDGYFGTLTQQAVMAFQGAEDLQRDGVVGPKTRRALLGAHRPLARSDSGNLVEIDEERGLLMVVGGGLVEWAFHTSTGTDEPYIAPDGTSHAADTPDGRWAIAWAFDGWRDGPLGRMWRPRYFHSEGVAIHGFESVPPYPASHGCARVSIAAMNFIWEHNLAPEGGTVWVY